MRKFWLPLVFILYIGSYILLRLVSTEVWNKDGRVYVIFPKEPIAIYYLFRPLSYLDGKLTGIGTHIGPHN